MNELHALYADKSCLESCVGCSILKKPKPFHSHMDYENLNQADVLFVSDSLKYQKGRISPFKDGELNIILESLSPYDNYSVEYTASVKCPNVKEADIKTEDKYLCRRYLEETIEKVRPKLVFACGNLALNMLTKKSGINSKRGEAYLMAGSDFEYTVVPLHHPYSLIIEPEKRKLFFSDVSRSYDRYILGKTQVLDLDYHILRDVDDILFKGYERLFTTTDTLAIDLETEGLNFLEHNVLTVAMCWGSASLVIPIKHKDHVWSEEDYEKIIDFLSQVMRNPNNSKVFHNATFDLKFLMSLGLKDFRNIEDTKLKYHVTENENDPKGLMDLVKKYFPQYLESF